MSTTKNTRGGTALRGALAAGTATALLLGGFGAFALWNDSQDAGATGAIATGLLELDPIAESVQWQLDNPQGGGAAVTIADLTTFRASPGDVLSYNVPVTGTVTGSDITAELTVDFDQIGIDPAVDSDVTITVAGADGQLIEIVGTAAGTAIDEIVSVRVEFAESMTGGMNLPAAVDVDGMDLVLQQLA